MFKYGNGYLVGDYPKQPLSLTDTKTSRKAFLLSLIAGTMFIMIPIQASANTNPFQLDNNASPSITIEEEYENLIESTSTYDSDLSTAIDGQIIHDDALTEAIEERKSTNNMTYETAYCTPVNEDAIWHADTDDAYTETVVASVNYEYVPSSGGCLTPSAGVYYGPSGKETYYNLDMSGVVAIAYSNGITGEYWVRSDGCKMLGDYIICACNRGVHPYGSLVETSLGTGISLDTGGFAAGNPTQIDIATAW